MVLKSKIKNKLDIYSRMILDEATPASLKKHMSEVAAIIIGFFVFGLLLMFYQPALMVICLVISIGLFVRLIGIMNIASKKEYVILRGVIKGMKTLRTTKLTGIEIQPSTIIILETEEGDLEIRLSKSMRLVIGGSYEFCFRNHKDISTGIKGLDLFMNTGQFLGCVALQNKKSNTRK